MIKLIEGELIRLGLAQNGYTDSIAVYEEEEGIRLSDGTGEWYGSAEVALDALKRHPELSWDDFWTVFMDDGVVKLGN